MSIKAVLGPMTSHLEKVNRKWLELRTGLLQNTFVEQIYNLNSLTCVTDTA